CEMPARAGDAESPWSTNCAPRSAKTGSPSRITVPMSTARMTSESSRQATRRPSNTRPFTSGRVPRSARFTLPSTAPPALRPIVVSPIVRPRCSVHLAYAAHDAVGDHVQAERDGEQDDADEVEARDGQPGAPHVLGAGGERGHRRGHGQAAVERIGGEAGGVGGATRDEHHHRLADGAGGGEDER